VAQVIDLSLWVAIASRTRRHCWAEDAEKPWLWWTVNGAPFSLDQSRDGVRLGYLIQALRQDETTETVVVKVIAEYALPPISKACRVLADA
jgi:hypothetical protein